MAQVNLKPPARFYGFAVFLVVLGPLVAGALGYWALDSLGDSVDQARQLATPVAEELRLKADESFEIIAIGDSYSIDNVSMWMLDANGKGVGLHTGASRLRISHTSSNGRTFKIIGFMTDLPAGKYTLGAVGPSGTRLVILATPRNVGNKVLLAKVGLSLFPLLGLAFALMLFVLRRKDLQRILSERAAEAPPEQSYGVGISYQQFKAGMPNDPFDPIHPPTMDEAEHDQVPVGVGAPMSPPTGAPVSPPMGMPDPSMAPPSPMAAGLPTLASVQPLRIPQKPTPQPTPQPAAQPEPRPAPRPEPRPEPPPAAHEPAASTPPSPFERPSAPFIGPPPPPPAPPDSAA